MTATDLLYLGTIKSRQREGTSDEVQLRMDRDWLVGRLEECLALVRDLRRAIGDIEILCADARTDAFAAEQLARMVRTDSPVPASPPGGGGR